VPRIILGPKWEEATGGWRRLHYEECRNLYASPNTFRLIKSRGMRWIGHVACMGEMRNAFNIFVVKPEGKRPLEDIGVDGKIILK
jgi:hypothetical protein